MHNIYTPLKPYCLSRVNLFQLLGINHHHGQVNNIFSPLSSFQAYIPSHPVHPATVHFPITFITLTGLLDMFYAAASSPATAPLIQSALKSFDVQAYLHAIPLFSYYTTILALITAIPAIVTGGMELMPLIQRDGLNTPKARIGVAHAVLNDLSVFALAYNWWTRRAMNDFAPSTTNLAISAALALPASSFAAYLGGSLVYEYGMGVGRASAKAKDKKGQ